MKTRTKNGKKNGPRSHIASLLLVGIDVDLGGGGRKNAKCNLNVIQ